MKNYNSHLLSLRQNAQLSLKDAAKQIGINKWLLYFYENGYFRPSKKNLEKINKFYQEEVSIEGTSAYPAPIKEKALKHEKENLKVKRIIFGSVSGAILLSIAVGAILFNQSVDNTRSFYGDTYNQMHDKVMQVGDTGYDLATSLKYHFVKEENELEETTVIFYETNNILYFNECTYSTTSFATMKDLIRYHYQLGFNLGINSFVCEFNYGNFYSGASFTCNFEYSGGAIDGVYNFKNLIKGVDEIDELEAIRIVNSKIDGLNKSFSNLLSKYLEKEVDFCKDFLPDREQGRKINFSLQISSLLLIFPGIFAFYIIFGIFIKLMIQNIKPRLVSAEPEKESSKKEPLPKDLNINYGIPDVFIVLLGKILQYGSMILFSIAFIARLGIPFLRFLANPNLLTVFKFSLLAGIFLEHFVMIGRIKKPTTLFHQIIYNLGFFLFIATIETVIISLTNAWGYDFASLIYKYIPGNVYQVVAVHYLIFLFLFFQPSFLNKKKKYVRIIWHSLSLIPLGFLIATYILSNAYALMYGVQENVFVNFWFPNGFLSLSIVCVLFLYATFAIRLFYEKKYGRHNAQLFFYGDRYTIYENVICAGLIIIAAALDFIFIHNQYAYYLGLGGNVWMFTLVPFILLCKYSPNNQQIFLVDEQITIFSRE